MEQAEALQEEMIKVAPTMRKLGSELWFSWNPRLRTDWCWQRFMVNPRPTDVLVTANWSENPWWYETEMVPGRAAEHRQRHAGRRHGGGAPQHGLRCEGRLSQDRTSPLQITTGVCQQPPAGPRTTTNFPSPSTPSPIFPNYGTGVAGACAPRTT